MRYKIEFHTFWHCGSGQAAGADVDELVIRDKQGFPYVPGRTIKGLLRDASEEICLPDETIVRIFGLRRQESNKDIGEIKDLSILKGKAHFSDACLSYDERTYIEAMESDRAGDIISDRSDKDTEEQYKTLNPFLFRSIASTAIEEDTGIAKDFSLRKIEVTIPCTLYGTIDRVDKDDSSELERAMKYIKRLGLGRNRGFGRCTISWLNDYEK